MESVDIIASGYEWECPNCETLNKMIAYPSSQIVTCASCGNEYEVGLPEHAID